MAKVEQIQVFDKPFREMDWDELKLERRAHGWLKYKVEKNAYHLTTKLYALEQKPFYTKEQYRKMYEDGELTTQEYRVMAMNMKNLKTDIAATKAQIQYGFAVVDHELAIMTELDEIMEARRAHHVKQKVKTGTKTYDPRKKISWDNHNSKNRTEKLHPPKRSTKYRQKWNMIRAHEASAKNALKKIQPLAEWDKDKLKKIARSRGVFSDQTLCAMVADELRTTVGFARKILTTGKMTWGQCIVIGALFEMTPAEFCDVFLSGVFREVVDGKWVAVVDDKDALLDRLPQQRAMPNADEADEDDENDEADTSCGTDEESEV